MRQGVVRMVFIFISSSDFPGCFSFFAKVQWNGLPAQLQSIDSEAVFKVKLKRFLMEGYV